jgi:hypothetical protein
MGLQFPPMLMRRKRPGRARRICPSDARQRGVRGSARTTSVLCFHTYSTHVRTKFGRCSCPAKLPHKKPRKLRSTGSAFNMWNRARATPSSSSMGRLAISAPGDRSSCHRILWHCPLEGRWQGVQCRDASGRSRQVHHGIQCRFCSCHRMVLWSWQPPCRTRPCSAASFYTRGVSFDLAGGQRRRQSGGRRSGKITAPLLPQ